MGWFNVCPWLLLAIPASSAVPNNAFWRNEELFSDGMVNTRFNCPASKLPHATGFFLRYSINSLSVNFEKSITVSLQLLQWRPLPSGVILLHFSWQGLGMLISIFFFLAIILKICTHGSCAPVMLLLQR